MKQKNIIVTKASGLPDEYSAEKLRRSLEKSGIGKQVIDGIINAVETKLYNGISTKKIYQLAFDLLKKSSRSQAGRYNLKRAIMAMGPSGYPFEQYIGAIFEWQGYLVKVKQFLEGVCVTHEIDVLAENARHALLIECKYHNKLGIVSDVKVPLYINSRYHDVQGRWIKNFPTKPLEGWVVTNTKFSVDAIKYGACSGLQLLGWNYPPQRSLSTLVDESRLYPVTCLTTLTNREKEQVLESGTVLCKDIQKNQAILNLAAISKARIPGIMGEINALCRS